MGRGPQRLTLPPPLHRVAGTRRILPTSRPVSLRVTNDDPSRYWPDQPRHRPGRSDDMDSARGLVRHRPWNSCPRFHPKVRELPSPRNTRLCPCGQRHRQARTGNTPSRKSFSPSHHRRLPRRQRDMGNLRRRWRITLLPQRGGSLDSPCPQTGKRKSASSGRPGAGRLQGGLSPPSVHHPPPRLAATTHCDSRWEQNPMAVRRNERDIGIHCRRLKSRPRNLF